MLNNWSISIYDPAISDYIGPHGVFIQRCLSLGQRYLPNIETSLLGPYRGHIRFCPGNRCSLVIIDFAFNEINIRLMFNLVLTSVSVGRRCLGSYGKINAMKKSQKALFAYFTSNQILPFGFSDQCRRLRCVESGRFLQITDGSGSPVRLVNSDGPEGQVLCPHQH